MQAQAAQVDADIALLRKRPKGMDEETWREKRRDAARELGDLGDKRAVEPLLEIVQSERFDAILEISIQSLGKLGDSKAVPALKRIVEDPSIETYVRDSAREALRKLGAESEGAGGAGGGGTGGGGRVAQGGATDVSSLLRATQQIEGLPPLAPPSLPAGTIALAERVTFALGSVNLVHDSAGGGTVLGIDLGAAYHRQMELPRVGYSFDAAVHTGYQDRNLRAGGVDVTSYLILLGAGIAADTRLYLIEGLPVFEFLTLAPSISYDFEKNRAAMETSASLTLVDFDIGGGIGYGRVLPVGARLRLRRIEAVLETAGVRARPINSDTAARILVAWYGLRGRLGYYAELVYTLRILREAGVLLQEPDPATVYKILAVLSDPQLDDRREGMDVRVGGYYSIEDLSDVDTPNYAGVLGAGTYAHQLSDRADIEGHVRGFLRANEDRKPYVLSADATFRLFFYSAEQDPQGALSLGAFGDLSDSVNATTIGASWDVGVRTSFTHFFSRASNVGLGLEMATQSAEDWRLMLTLRAAYGLAPAELSFAP